MAVPPVTFVSSVDRYLVYLDAEPFVPLLLASYWCLVLKLQLGSVTHSPLLAPPPGMDSPWKFVSCLKILKVCFAGCLRLICITVAGLAVAGLGAPLSRFLEGTPYKFLNEWMNYLVNMPCNIPSIAIQSAVRSDDCIDCWMDCCITTIIDITTKMWHNHSNCFSISKYISWWKMTIKDMNFQGHPAAHFAQIFTRISTNSK